MRLRLSILTLLALLWGPPSLGQPPADAAKDEKLLALTPGGRRLSQSALLQQRKKLALI